MSGIANMVFANRVPAATGPTDPNFASVELLLQGGQSNGSTTIVDSSGNGRTPVTNQDVDYSNTQVKWQSTSLKFDGDDYLGYTYTADLQPSGDFTWEAWLYPTTLNGFPTLMGYGANGIALLYHNTGGSIKIEMDKDGTGLDVNHSTGTSLTINVWQHLAVTRSGSDVRVFKDGTQIGSTQTLTGAPSINRNVSISSYVHPSSGGGASPANYFTGYMDDIRFTNGVARYTANFTAPTAAFPTQ